MMILKIFSILKIDHSSNYAGILKSLGTTDDLISEKFVLKDCNKCACGKNDDVNESIQTVNISQTIDLKHFEQSIISKYLIEMEIPKVG